MTTAPTPVTFTMLGAREAIAGGMRHVEEHVKGLERAVSENPGLAFDLAKALIESVCRTILSDRTIGFSNDADLPELFRLVTRQLPLLPANASTEIAARSSLKKTLGGLHTALQGVCELRNNYGFVSHGTDGRHIAMESVQALFVAQTADAIVGFLYRSHLQERARLPGVRLEYKDNVAFNEYVDQANDPVRIFLLEYRPSEVLFSVDGEAYREALVGYSPDVEDEVKEPSAEPDAEVIT